MSLYREKLLGYYHIVKNNKKLLSLAIILGLTISIPTTVSLGQTFLDIRQHADTYSATVTVNPTTAKPGDRLTVNWTIQQTLDPTPTTAPTNTPTPTTGTILVSARPNTISVGDSITFYWNYQGLTPNAGDFFETFLPNGNGAQYIFFNSCTATRGTTTPAPTGTCTITNTSNYLPNTYTVKVFRFDDPINPLNQDTFITVNPTPTVTPPTTLAAPQNFRIAQQQCYVSNTPQDLNNNPGHKFRLSWNAVSNADDYLIYMTTRDDQPWTLIRHTKETTTEIFYPLTDENTMINRGVSRYYFIVKASRNNFSTIGPQSHTIPLNFCNVDTDQQGFLFVPKAHAQSSTFTGSETLQLVNTSDKTKVGKALYLNCTTKDGSLPPSSPISSGQCSLTVPSDTTPGTYVIELLAADGTTLLGASQNITITQNATPVYRLLKTDKSDFFWASPAQKDTMITQTYQGQPVWDTNPGIAWYAFSSPQPETTPVYRLLKSDKSAFYWATTSEKDAMLAQTYNGVKVWDQNPVIVWYAYTSP